MVVRAAVMQEELPVKVEIVAVAEDQVSVVIERSNAQQSEKGVDMQTLPAQSLFSPEAVAARSRY